MAEWTEEEEELLRQNGQLGVRLAVAKSRLDRLMALATEEGVVATADDLRASQPLLLAACQAIEAVLVNIEGLILKHRHRMASGELSKIQQETARTAGPVVRPLDPRTN